MRILVTGSDGLLGSNIVRALLERGHDVNAFIHPSSPAKTLIGLPVNKCFGDILNIDSIKAAINGCSAVVHAAANTNVWPAKSETIRNVNIIGTKNMISVALEEKIVRFIYIGSASSVTITDAKISTIEDTRKNYGLDYIDSKREALQLVLHAVQNEGLPALCILPTFMIGAFDALPSSGKMILALATNKLNYYSSGGRNFVHVKDVADAAVNALVLGTIGSCYIAGNVNLTYEAFFNKVATIVGNKRKRTALPDWVIKTIGFLGSRYGNITKRPPMISYPVARICCEKQFYRIEEAITILKMPQTEIEIAISDCLDWFKMENYY